MNEKIKFAHMHQTGFLPGLNKQVAKGLDAKTYTGLEMQMGFAGVNCKYQGERFVIPYVNFQSIVLADEESSETEKTDSRKKKNA